MCKKYSDVLVNVYQHSFAHFVHTYFVQSLQLIIVKNSISYAIINAMKIITYVTNIHSRSFTIHFSLNIINVICRYASAHR